MRVCTLASSSSGNCILVFTPSTKILVDIGLTVSEVELKLNALGIKPYEINAILLTHEHSDHIKGVGSFMRKHKTKLYLHNNALHGARGKLGKIDASQIIPFYDFPFEVGEFKINAFGLPHDASFCVGYNIWQDNKKISIATDFGHTTSSIIENLYNSRLVILESNHDEKMLLKNPNYSSLLKSRILSKNGHLSNVAAAKVVCALAENNVKQVVLAHLSKENNTPELAYSTVCEYLAAANLPCGISINVDVASPHKIGTIFYLK